MLCHKCKEHIEVGEACTTLQVGGYTRYLHVGCAHSYNPIREREDAENENEEWERIARQARNVC